MPKSESGTIVRKTRVDASDTFGVRGGGSATWQAQFGMALNEQDLVFAVRREPVAKRTVIDVAFDMFAKGFTVEEVAEKPDPNWSRDVSKVLDGLNAKAVLTRLFLYERLFGWSILACTYVDYGESSSAPLVRPREIRELLPYGSFQCSVQSGDEDKNAESARFGLPVSYTVRRSGSGSQKKIHYSRVIHCATRLLDHPWKGLSALEVIYDDLTVFRNERWALGETLVRLGHGFADVSAKGADKSALDKLENSRQFAQLNARTYFLHSDQTTLDFKGIAGKAVNPEPYVTSTVESLACGTRIPTTHLRGANAGTLAGSEVNDREYWGGIAALQPLAEPIIWDLVDRLMETGQIRRGNDYRVVWPAGFELSEISKASIELQLAQARNLKTGWKTVDEIRAEEDLEPLPNGSGAVVLGLNKGSQQSAFEASPVAGADAADSGRFVGLLLKFRRKKKV
jgi:phage-related protein (TIGR01555 family)